MCITKNGWILIDKYIDEGKSGTTTSKRCEYNRLCDEMKSNKFDIVVIKSQDRLMRNVKDWYLFLDILVLNHKKLYYYLDSKFYTPDDALITGIKAILAEEFSRELSKKINNAHHNRQLGGKSVVITSKTWGYDKIDKKVVINQEESEIVKEIFNLCTQGYGSRSISKILSNKGVKNRSGGEFSEITVRKILRNTLYKGTAVMNKRHIDFNSKQTIKNDKDKWIIHENAVPAIIDKEIWTKANANMDKRVTIEKCKDRGEQIRGYYKGKFNLSSKIICGYCNTTYWRRKRKTKSKTVIEWMCSTYCIRGRRAIEKKKIANQVIETPELGCDNIHINEAYLLKIFSKIADDIYSNKFEKVLDKVSELLNSVLCDVDYSKEISELQFQKENARKQKEMLMDKLLDSTISDVDFKEHNFRLSEKMKSLDLKLKEIKLNDDGKINVQEKISNIKEMLISSAMDETKVVLLIQHIDKIMVYNDYIEIYLNYFKFAISMDYDMKKSV